MRYALVLAPEAARQYMDLSAYLRAQVRDALDKHLRHDPGRTSRSRVKRLRGLVRPQYRLRVGEIRVYYDVAGPVVEILAIIRKSDAERWLEERGEPE
ncbi:MAG TPA: type II toxin-antitoxin system RelE/ParE family toxin [Candidatus Methylomirabilis sp.]|nr:type II toxin-antitoxin system RelE/ParE family toxin [Candidatus Methylomirabilis sp.]